MGRSGAWGAALGGNGTQLLLNHVLQSPGAAGEQLRVWDIAGARAIRILDAPPSSDADWNESANLAITSNGSNRSVLWNTTAWTEAAPLPADVQGDATTFALSPDGHLLAIGAKKNVFLIDSSTGVNARSSLPRQLPWASSPRCSFHRMVGSSPR